MKHHVIYIPGLGDKRIGLQRAAARSWRLYGVRPETFHVRWYDGEAFAPKLERLLERIDAFKGEGHAVSLVGASAGGSAAINAFAARAESVHRVVLISGEVNGRENISPHTYRANPAFQDSMAAVEASLERLDDKDRARILSLRARFDPVVSASDSIIPGAHNHQLKSAGHSTTIALQIALGARSFLRFIKTGRYK